MNLSCGLWVMAAVDTFVTMVDSPEFTEMPYDGRVILATHVLAKSKPTSEWRRRVMFNICATMLRVFCNFPITQHLANPFAPIVAKRNKDKADAQIRDELAKQEAHMRRRKMRKVSTTQFVGGALAPPAYTLIAELSAQKAAAAETRKRKATNIDEMD